MNYKKKECIKISKELIKNNYNDNFFLLKNRLNKIILIYKCINYLIKMINNVYCILDF